MLALCLSWCALLVQQFPQKKDRFTGTLLSAATGPNTMINIFRFEDDQVSRSVSVYFWEDITCWKSLQ